MEEFYDRDLCPDHLFKTPWECQRQIGKLLNLPNTHRKSWKSIEETGESQREHWETQKVVLTKSQPFS